MFRPCVSVFLLSLFLGGVSASLNDPHPFTSSNGPYMEGWYLRIVDADGGFSFGLVFGLSAPASGQPPKDVQKRPAYVGVIFHDSPDSTANYPKSMQVFNALPGKNAVEIFAPADAKVPFGYENPSVDGVSSFRWCAREQGVTEGCFTADEKRQEISFDFSIQDKKENRKITFKGVVDLEGGGWDTETAGDTAAHAHNYGPMAQFINLPLLPLAWFVHATHARVRTYQYTETQLSPVKKIRAIERAKTGVFEVRGDRDGAISYKNKLGAHMHMEKNWGSSFPDSWIWSQMYNAETGNYFALTYGLLDTPWKLPIPAHLFGYRNFEKKIFIDYRPDNSYVSEKNFDACKGEIMIEMKQLLGNSRLRLRVSADRSSFGKAFPGPMQWGFQDICEETYNAVAKIEVYMKGDGHFFAKETLVESGEFPLSALEFGGNFRCKYQQAVGGDLTTVFQ